MRVKPSLLLCVGVLAVATVAGAAPRVSGPEMQVNQVSTHVEQRHPVAAYARSGGALVVWEDEQAGLKGRFLAKNGHTVGSDLTLVTNQLLASIPASGNVVYRRSPAVAFLPNGGFALLWTEEMDFELLDAFIQQDTLLRRDVYGRIFSAAGAPVGGAFRVNGAGERMASAPQVVVRGSDFLVAYQNQSNAQKGVFLRRFNLSGQPIGAEIQVSAPSVVATDPAIAVGAGGRVAVAFDAPDASGLGAFVQLFNANLQPLGGEVRVNTTVAGDQFRPAIAANAAGQYLVAWSGQYGSPHRFRVFGQVVGETGNLIGGQLALSGGTNRYEVLPSVAAGRHGDFLAVWLAFNKDALPAGIYANQVDALGRPGTEEQINMLAVNYNTRSSLVADGAGHFLAPWEGFAGQNPAIAAQLISE
jgi:hypothetical protein